MIRVGVAGWDYRDWEGIVYPSPLPGRFDRLAFLAGFFDLIEINMTFYRLPEAGQARSWAGRAGAGGCRFTAKLYRVLTHPGHRSGAPARPDAGELAEYAGRFRSGIAPLQAAGLLLCVLAQFPHSFHDGRNSRAHLALLRKFLPDLPLVAEFRHRSWDNIEALQCLRDLGIGFCNIDQPAIGSTLRPTAHVTSPITYIRLHGRNTANWFLEGVSVSARYDYLYSMEELRPWVERAALLNRAAEEVLIIANNHYRGKGPTNALMVKAALTGGRVSAPPELLSEYPDLRSVADPGTPPPAQGRLF